MLKSTGEPGRPMLQCFRPPLPPPHPLPLHTHPSPPLPCCLGNTKAIFKQQTRGDALWEQQLCTPKSLHDFLICGPVAPLSGGWGVLPAPPPTHGSNPPPPIQPCQTSQPCGRAVVDGGGWQGESRRDGEGCAREGWRKVGEGQEEWLWGEREQPTAERKCVCAQMLMFEKLQL